MADGFIVRRGGRAEEVLRTATPDINFVSKTNTEIVVTFKNNDATEADVFYGLTSPLTTKVTLATDTTSSNITFSGLDGDTQYTISAYAIVTDATLKKIKSEVVSTNITTDAPIYTAATGGTTLEYNLDNKRYRSHTFLEDDDFIVTTVGDADGDRNKVDYLIIAGGGAGGSNAGAPDQVAGGGAGGYRTTIGTQGGNGTLDSKVTVTAQTYNIIIGAGGAAQSTSTAGNNGSNSSGLSITSTGGGGGGGLAISDAVAFGKSGGSGGGTVGRSGTNAGGTGTANQGTNGGSGSTDGSTFRSSGGGGGAGEAGENGSTTASIAGSGGNGLSNLLRTGSNETRAGGGGGGASAGDGSGGSGGGGAGVRSGTGTSGTANTGSGGGGGQTSGSGGSGIVVIRYEIAPSV